MTHKSAPKLSLKTIPQVPEAIGIYNEALYERFVLWRDQSGASITRIATMLGRSTGLVSQYINRKYPRSVEEIEKDIATLLRREEDLEFVERPAVFCITRPATLIWEVLEYCDRHGKMGVALAPSGTGKTETCKEYKRQNRAAIFVTADISTRSMGSILRLIARHCGGVPRQQSINDLLHALIDRLKESRRLIIIDDAHFLSWEAFEIVHKIYDCAKIGIVYAGQERLYDQMKGNAAKNMLFDQIYSRIAIRRDDLTILKDDVSLVANSICAGLDGACIDFLFKKARGKGRLRVMCNLLEMAIEIHKQYGQPLGLELLQEANQFLMI